MDITRTFSLSLIWNWLLNFVPLHKLSWLFRYEVTLCYWDLMVLYGMCCQFWGDLPSWGRESFVWETEDTKRWFLSLWKENLWKICVPLQWSSSVWSIKAGHFCAGFSIARANSLLSLPSQLIANIQTSISICFFSKVKGLLGSSLETFLDFLCFNGQ